MDIVNNQGGKKKKKKNQGGLSPIQRALGNQGMMRSERNKLPHGGSQQTFGYRIANHQH